MIVERTDSLQTLRQTVTDAAHGRGQLVVVAGPAGIGKTALLRAIRESAGVPVLAAAATELERALPFGIVLQLLERRIARLGPKARADVLNGAAALARPLLEHATVAAAQTSQQLPVLHGLYWVVSNLAEIAPLLLTIDDVQWSDAPSMAFLEYLAPRLDDLPVAVVAGLRTSEPAPALLADAPRIVLRPLSPGAVAQLVRACFPEAADPFCDACAEASGGNPFLVRELLTSLDAPDPARLADITPAAVHRSVADRLELLPVACGAVARAISVLGPNARLEHVAALSGASHDGVLEAQELLAAHELLDDGAAFAHPLIRTSVYRSMPASQRRALHRRAAEVLARAGVGDQHVAGHLLTGEHRADAWAVDVLRAAADVSLAAGDPGTAASYLARALAEPPEDQLRVSILTALGRAETFAGVASATERLRAASRLAQPGAERARALLGLGRAHFLRGESLDAARAFDAGLAEGPSDVTDELQTAWLFAAHLHAPLMREAPARLLPYLDRAPAAATHAERVLLANIAFQLAYSSADRERLVGMARLAFGSGALVAEATPDELAWVGSLATLMYADDLDGYRDGIEFVLRDAQRRGSLIAYAAASYSRAVERYYRGRLAEAIADLQVNLQAGSEGFHFHVLAHARLCWCELDGDDIAAAEAALAPMIDHPYWSQTLLYAYILEARARVRLVQHRDQDALADSLAAIALADSAFPSLNPAVLPVYSTASLAAAAAGDPRANALAATELDRARRWGAPRALGVALRAAGLVERRSELLQEAVDVLAGSPSQLEYARALVDYGAALRRKGQRRAAGDALRTALDLAHRFGAGAIARQAREELVATGARPRRAALRGVDALTPSERRTAELAATGQTNREIAQRLFVTLRTVEAHLSSSYTKLGIQGRADLAAALDGP